MNAVIAQLAAAEKREAEVVKSCISPTPMILEPFTDRDLPRFENRAHLVEDVKAEEKKRLNSLNWTPAERDAFKEKYIQYPKNFRKIKTFLDFKSYGDCVVFYYQHAIWI